MDIEIIIGCDMHPDQVAEYAVAITIVERGENKTLQFKKWVLRAAAEIVYQVTSGEQNPPDAGETFNINQTFKTTFVSAPRP